MRATLQKIINYAVKAPALQDSRPWTFRAEGCSLFIYPDYSRIRRTEDDDFRQLFISLGCAVENAVVAANAFGYRDSVTCRFANDQDSVRITLEPAEAMNGQDLFLAIGERSTVRSSYRAQAIPAEQLADLALQARERNVLLKIFDTEEELRRLLPLVEEAVTLQYRDRDFPTWLRNPAGELMETGSVPRWMGSMYAAHADAAKVEARKVRELVQASAALVLFATTNNSKEGWVSLGRSYERLALRATALGIRHSLLNMPCEEKAVCEKLKRELGYGSEEPGLLIRLGYEKAASGSYRRQQAASGVGEE
ncbi:MAG TPA: hypothetical protein VGE66_04965 [Chitinophagaceae bacterium]